MDKLFLDTETYNEASLKVIGGDRYCRSADILLVTWAVNNGPVRLWDATQSFEPPAELVGWLADPSVQIWAHNSAFDRKIVEHDPRLPSPALRRWRCTMTKALTLALPGDLDMLCQVLGLPTDQAKLSDGKKLVRRFTQPTPHNYKARRFTAENDPAGWARFCEYARMDVVAMRECDARMPDWNYKDVEIDLWLLDQKINDHGFKVDRELVDAAAAATEDEKLLLRHRFQELTRGEVDAPSKREQLKAFLAWNHGLSVENTQKATFEQLLKRRDLAPELRELLEICLASNKTSTSKYARLQPAIGDDDRFRGSLQFAGAGRTRRSAGRTFQPQNLPSRGLPPSASVETYIECLKTGIHTACFDDLMLYGAAALRGVVVAPEGKHIVAADLSNIEGRMLAWLAGEKWKLDAFRAYDAGTGPDLYKVTAGIITGVDPWKVEKKIRNSIGKVADLSSGYAGGISGYQQFARAYNVRMADYWDVLQETVPDCAAKALESLNKPWMRRQIEKLEIDDIEAAASEACKLAWRRRHPATVSFWAAVESAMRQAIAKPGTTHQAPRVSVRCEKVFGHMWLQIMLPSKRRLCYLDPQIDPETRSISYMAMATEEGGPRIWQRAFTHGGKAVGNITSSSSRDLLFETMPAVESAGYEIVLSIHDELVTEAPVALDETLMCKILSTPPAWAPDIPLAATGFTSHRYKKDD